MSTTWQRTYMEVHTEFMDSADLATVRRLSKFIEAALSKFLLMPGGDTATWTKAHFLSKCSVSFFGANTSLKASAATKGDGSLQTPLVFQSGRCCGCESTAL